MYQGPERAEVRLKCLELAVAFFQGDEDCGRQDVIALAEEFLEWACPPQQHYDERQGELDL